MAQIRVNTDNYNNGKDDKIFDSMKHREQKY